MFRHIVVALDGSKWAERALPVAGRLSHTTGSRLLLLRIVHVPVLPGPATEPPRLLVARLGAEAKQAERYLLAAARHPDTELPSGSPLATAMTP